MFLTGVSVTVYAASQQSARAVDSLDEPHHHLLLNNEQVRVFALRLDPRDQSYVFRPYNFLMITLTESDMKICGKEKLRS